MKKKISIVILSTLLMTTANAQLMNIPDTLDTLMQGTSSVNPEKNDIPDGASGYLYGMGTGPVDRINMPPILKKTGAYRASWSAGLGYSCGKFDPFSNVEAMVNQAVSRFKEMPQQFVTSAQDAVAALPAYVMNKVNPTLYNTITKSIDDSFELFNMKFASCQELEAQITNNGNSYFDYFTAAKADRQRVEIASGNHGAIDDMKRTVDEGGADNGIVGAGGERKGGKDQPPFDAMNEVIIAGYNMLIGRKDTTDESDAGNVQHPMAKIFKSPKDAHKWASDIYGNRMFSLPENDSKTEGKAGVSIRYQYQTHRNNLLQLMHDLVRGNIKIDEFTQKSGNIKISPVEIEDLRAMEGYARDIALMNRSQTEAIRDMQVRLRYIREMLLAGLEEPSLVQSTVAGQVKQEITGLILRIEQNLYELSVMGEQG